MSPRTTRKTKAKTPSITLTDSAIAKLEEVIAANQNVIGLRLQIGGRANGQFEHVLGLVQEGASVQDDDVVESAGLRVYVEPRSAKYVDGVSIDYHDKGPDVSGLEFNNPNPLWFDEREVQIQQLFDEQINPAIAAHGGSVNLLGVDDTTAFVQLGGGCQGCGMADVTLKQGIEATILETVPRVERVVDQTDHASGESPYYKPEKK
jgi:Fe/S biogenesis protein NfuA